MPIVPSDPAGALDKSEPRVGRSSPWRLTLWPSAARLAPKRGFTPVLCTRTEGGLSEADYVDMLLDQYASGVVFTGGNCT
jgi:hypothetical protein